MLREVKVRRRRARIVLALPVAAWPGSDELADEVHRVAMTVSGVEEIEFDLTVMRDDERAALRVALRRDMFGVAGADGPADDTAAAPDRGTEATGNAHGPSPATTPVFLQPDSATRVIG